MAKSELTRLIESGDVNVFESRCLEFIESGEIPFPALAQALNALWRRGEPQRAETIGQMVLDSEAGRAAEPPTLLPLLTALLCACPDNANFRKLAAEAYRAAHGDKPIYPALLEISGLEGTTPARRSVRVLEICLPLEPGSALIKLTENRAAVVERIDPAQALYTLQSGGRFTTLGAGELVNEYEPVARDDFRVLKQLYPERLGELADSDPVKLVVNLLHAHGEAIDSDELKDELVPRVIEAGKWSGWWTKARAKLKRCQNVIIEGRSPVSLKYTEQAVTFEDETRDAFETESEPGKWLSIIEGYLREKTRRKETPDADLLRKIQDRMAATAETELKHHPADSLAIGLILQRLGESGFPLDEASKTLADRILSESGNPVAIISRLPTTATWDAALAVLDRVRPNDRLDRLAELLPRAPEPMLDRIAERLIEGERTDAVQVHIDAGVADPVDHPEIIYWLWKGPKKAAKLDLPSTRELLAEILATLSSLGRAESFSAEAIKIFRARMKAALGLRGYRRFRECLDEIDEGAAVTLRRQLDRMDGLGDNAPAEMLNILRERHPMLWKVRGPRPWEDPDVLWTTAPGLQEKQAAVDDLINVKMRENAKAIGAAAEHGDLSENSEYKFALEERDMLRARLAQLNDGLSKARVLERDDVPDGFVGVGSHVVIVDAESGTERRLTFFGPWESDVERGVYNYMAPVGLKLMGKRVGERATILFEGQEREFEIRSIANGFDHLPTGAANRGVEVSG
jgi:transcription elongation GreA/GreB family factor